MGETTLRLLVKGNDDIVDATLSKRDGGSKLDEGVVELVRKQFPDIALSAAAERSQGFAATRAEIDAGTTAITDPAVDIVVFSIAEDVRNLITSGANREESVNAVRESMAAVIEAVKQANGATMLIANASTIDPGDGTFDYSGLAEEPLSLRAQRLDVLLVEMSHRHGISIIDVDRLIAEVGGGEHVAAALDYSKAACSRIAGEVVRVLEDYGFFDDRPLLEQVGAGSA